VKIFDHLRLLRPVQWLKNLMLLFPPFLAGAIAVPGMAQRAVLPLASFCLASSATYVLNDLLDADSDAVHPRKMHRPIPSGRIRKGGALALMLLCAVAAFVLALSLSPVFSLLLTAYLAISASYSFKLKQIPLIDIFCIATGFVLRLEAGGIAFNIPITQWLFLSVFLLALFLSTGKRLFEREKFAKVEDERRRALFEYPPGFLDGTLWMCGAAVLVTYSVYVMAKPYLMYTVPLCAFGLLRYVFVVKSHRCGDPTAALLSDFPLLAVGGIWVVMVGLTLY
jgi:4-hydroxybenzoate polyprenyltransferase